MGLKKIIILAHDFPPFHSIGAKRPGSWFKHFNALGYYPVVVTRQWDTKINNYSDVIQVSNNTLSVVEDQPEGTIIRVPYQPDFKDRLILKYGMNQMILVRKFLSYISLYFRFLLKAFDPTRKIFDAAAAYLEKNDCDFILATGEPFILFKYAAQLSKQYDIPWIADYRDGWTSNQDNSSRGFLAKMLNTYYKKVEKKYLQEVSLITTAAPGYAADLRKVHPRKRVEVIYNGFESEVLADISSIDQRNDIFEIAYAGTLYPYQQLETFLSGYQKFIQEHQPNIRLIFYGLSFYPEMVGRVNRFDEILNQYILFTERMDYPILMKKLRKAHLMLLLSNENVNWLSAKIFDYLAVNRKVVLVKNDFAILEKIVKDTNCGVALSESDEVAQFLASQYHEFLKTGKVKNQSNVDHFYSRSHQAACMVNLINGLKTKQSKILTPTQKLNKSCAE